MGINVDHTVKRGWSYHSGLVLLAAGAAALLAGGCGNGPAATSPTPSGSSAMSPEAIAAGNRAAAERIQLGPRVNEIQDNPSMTPEQKQAAIQSLQIQAGQRPLPSASSGYVPAPGGSAADAGLHSH